MPEEKAAACPKVAVIAIHGVADQAPYETARLVAGLLLKRNVDTTNLKYSAFNETPVQIPNRPVHIDNSSRYEGINVSRASRWQRLRNYFINKLDERSPYIAELHKKERAVDQSPPNHDPQSNKENDWAKPEESVKPDSPDYGFMHGQLCSYKGEGPGATYDSLRLAGARLDDNGKRQQDVHIYEMYWADLSRLGSTFTQIFSELYQLLFHLASLGRQTIDFARLESGNQKSLVWSWLSHLQSWAVRMLTLPIPILNLWMVAVLLLVIPARLDQTLQGPIAMLVIAVWAAYRYGKWSFEKGKNLPYFLWALNAVMWTALITSLAYVFASYFLGEKNDLERINSFLGSSFSMKVLCLEWCLVSMLCLRSLMSMYARRRPGADLVGDLIGWPIFVGLVVLIVFADNNWQGITVAALTMFEVIHSLLYLSWTIFLLLQITATLVGELAVWRTRKEKTKEKESAHNRAVRATYTARISLALPVALIIFMNVLIWFTAASAGSSFLARVDYTPRLPLLSQLIKSGDGLKLTQADESMGFCCRQFGWRSKPELKQAGKLTLSIGMASMAKPLPLSSAQILIKQILERNYLAFALFTITFGLAVIFAICSVAPIVWVEARPPLKEDQESQKSNHLGNWLSRGFRQMRFSGELIFFSTAIIYPLSAIFFYDDPPIWVNKILEGVGGLLAASTAGLVISGLRITGLRKEWDSLSGKLNKFTLGFRPALDVALDVDNHLREHPREGNPRARICARYVSLLRHICKWKDPDGGKGYDAVLIVSHSQGTVITADLLRFLKRERDPELGRLYPERARRRAEKHIPIYLLTLGCPLRQLYSLRFPHLYRWARHTDLNKWDKDDPLHIPDDQLPDPQALGVAVWMNAFRSGDYVGRYLWRSDNCGYQWNHNAPSPNSPQAWTSPLNKLVTITQDKEGLRQEFCIRPGAHTHYLDRTAPEISAAIDHLIEQATSNLKRAAKGGD